MTSRIPPARGGSHRLQQQNRRPLAATAAAMGGAGVIIATPAAALVATADVAQAAPLFAPLPQQLGNLGSFFGSGGLGGLDSILAGDIFSPSNPIYNIFGLASLIPGLNI